MPGKQDMLMQAAVEAAVAENLKPLELDVNTVGGGHGVGLCLVEASFLVKKKEAKLTRCFLLFDRLNFFVCVKGSKFCEEVERTFVMCCHLVFFPLLKVEREAFCLSRGVSINYILRASARMLRWILAWWLL